MSLAARELHNSAVVITGGASGIGEATARHFARLGAKVWIGDLDLLRAQSVAAEIGGQAARCDVTCEQDVATLIDNAFRHEGHLATVINNAGAIGVRGSITETDADGWNQTVALLLNSVFYGMKHAARVMKDQGYGSILSTASNASVAALGPHCYAACKSGVLGLTRSVAAEMARFGVTVNAIAPGMVPTALTSGVYGDEGARELSAEVNPLGAVLETETIAQWFAHLAGPAGKGITGQTIVVDGGTTTVLRPNAHY